MSHTVADNQVIYAFDKNNQPVLRVASGEEVTLETCDCFDNQLKTPSDTIDKLDWDHINPATGPVFVEGAEPGDVLKVEILKIDIGDQASFVTGEGVGVCGERFSNGLINYYAPIRDGKLIFDSKFSIDLDPMVGVIGVAPANGESIACGTPGHHGGNMDNTMVREGATIYFPVAVEGALFAAGDMHAAMGDGEIGVSGAEVPGKLTVRLSVLKDRSITSPVLEDTMSFSTIASAESFDQAGTMAVCDMLDIVTSCIDMQKERFVTLMSLVGNLEVCQVVDPLKTARFVMPKDALEAYGFKW